MGTFTYALKRLANIEGGTTEHRNSAQVARLNNYTCGRERNLESEEGKFQLGGTKTPNPCQGKNNAWVEESIFGKTKAKVSLRANMESRE